MTTTQFRTSFDPRLAGSIPVARTAPGGSQDRKADRKTLRPLLIDLGVPLASYYLLREVGCDLVTSLALSSVIPAARTVFGVIKSRTFNGLAALIVVVNAVSIAISFWSGDPRIMLAKDGVVSSTIGIAILVSVWAGRPLMTAGMKPFLVKGDAGKAAAFDRLKATSRRFGVLEGRFSLVWGIALLMECAARVACAFTLPVGTVVWLSTVITISAIVAAIFVGTIFTLPMEKMVKLEAAEE